MLVSNFLYMAISLKLRKVISIEIFLKIFLTWFWVEMWGHGYGLSFSPLSLSPTSKKSLERLIESKS